jgi:glycosyltransferase involved in cell wall biosynthesis
LNECLSRLLPQIERGSSIRVLVIDNNSSDETKQTVSIKQEKYYFLDYAFCKEQGLSHARNYALKEADSIWLSFLDDDGYPDNDWLEENLRIIDSRNFDAFGGVYLPWYRNGKKDWFKDNYESNESRMPQGEETKLLPGDSYFAGGNCTFKVKAICSVGGFPLTLGMNGKTMGYGEEVAVQRLIAMRGYVLGYSRNLVLHHYVPIHKQRIRWVWRREYSVGKDFWTIYEKQPSLGNISLYGKVILKENLKYTKRTLKQFFSKGTTHKLNNVFYELAGWARFIGLIIGALKNRSV